MADRKTAVMAATIGMFVFTVSDLLRLRWPWLNGWILTVFGRVMRQNEANGLAGTTYLVTGVFFIIFLFPKDVVAVTLLFLALGDPLASYFGIRYGRDRIFRNKSLQGGLAAFICCAIIAFAYYSYYKLMLERVVLVSLISGLIGAISEIIPIGKLDDNLTFPIICSSGLWLVFKVFM